MTSKDLEIILGDCHSSAWNFLRASHLLPGRRWSPFQEPQMRPSCWLLLTPLLATFLPCCLPPLGCTRQWFLRLHPFKSWSHATCSVGLSYTPVENTIPTLLHFTFFPHNTYHLLRKWLFLNASCLLPNSFYWNKNLRIGTCFHCIPRCISTFLL